VDLLVGDEVGDLDRPVSLHTGRFEVLLLHHHELAALELERLGDLVVRDRLVLELADLLVADRALVRLVNQVEAQLVLGDRAVQTNGHVDQPEADRAGPDRPWHSSVSYLRGSRENAERRLTA